MHPSKFREMGTGAGDAAAALRPFPSPPPPPTRGGTRGTRPNSPQEKRRRPFLKTRPGPIAAEQQNRTRIENQHAGGGEKKERSAIENHLARGRRRGWTIRRLTSPLGTSPLLLAISPQI